MGVTLFKNFSNLEANSIIDATKVGASLAVAKL